MRILLYNQNKTELKKMSDDVMKALDSELVMLDISYSFLKSKKKLNNVIYDIAIIDMSEGKEDVLFLIRHLRNHHKECMIILLGNDYKESLFAFEIKAAYFGLKEDTDLKRIMKDMVERYKKNYPFVYIRKDDKRYKVYTKDVVYLEMMGKYISLVCHDKRYSGLKKENQDVLDMFIKYGFIQIHAGYYIHPDKILSFKKGEVTLINGDSISVSLKYRDMFYKYLNGAIDNNG